MYVIAKSSWCRACSFLPGVILFGHCSITLEPVRLLRRVSDTRIASVFMLILIVLRTFPFMYCASRWFSFAVILFFFFLPCFLHFCCLHGWLACLSSTCVSFFTWQIDVLCYIIYIPIWKILECPSLSQDAYCGCSAADIWSSIWKVSRDHRWRYHEPPAKLWK